MEEEVKEIRGYKVFEPDWTCRGFQYTCPGRFKEDVEPECCERGFHFCENLADCFGYYDFDPDNKVAEVIAHGETDTDGTRTCTNEIEIIRELSWEEVLRTVNTGKGCSGHCNSGNCNSGNCNSGNCNSGNCNSGNRNSGNRNSGNRNSGNRNSGDCNSGNCNSGNRNSGDYNSGDYNSGDWNKCSFSNGCFNTIEPKIYLFNKPSNWTYNDWLDSTACDLLSDIRADVLEYVRFDDMTAHEKATHPEAETTGSYLKKLDNSDCAQIWWDGLSEEERDIIRGIPNFDPAIFEEITGIKMS